MLKGFKYRIYPTEQQKVLIEKHIGACRFVYNLALETKQIAWSSARKNMTCFDLHKQLTELKYECPWLREVSSQSLQQSITNLDKAYTYFFKGSAKFPVFKKKRNSGSFNNPHGKKVSVIGGNVFIPKFMDGIAITQHKPIVGAIRNSTISKTATGKYYISLLCETGEIAPKLKAIKESTSLGIDLGLKSFIVTSDGEKVDAPKHLRKSLNRLKYFQRQQSKKQKGSANRKKSRHKVALIHEKVTNQRQDFLHNLSSKLVSENQALCFEDLNVAGMVKNHKLALSINDAGWSEFVRQITYKAEWRGKNLVQIGRFEPSSKLCSSCGSRNNDIKLSDREWTCDCGVTHDRDKNAAINIKNFALRNSGDARRKKSVELPTLVGAMKQKAKGSQAANKK